MGKIPNAISVVGQTRADFCKDSEIYTLISRRLSVENKAKLSQLETQNNFSAVLLFAISS